MTDLAERIADGIAQLYPGTTVVNHAEVLGLVRGVLAKTNIGGSSWYKLRDRNAELLAEIERLKEDKHWLMALVEQDYVREHLTRHKGCDCISCIIREKVGKIMLEGDDD